MALNSLVSNITFHCFSFPANTYILQKTKKILNDFLDLALEYKFAKEKADFIRKVLSNKMKALFLPFPLLPSYLDMVALDMRCVCLMGLFLHTRLLVLECFQDQGRHQLARC